MKARVKAKNCKIKVTTYFNEYYLNFNADDVLEIEVDEKITDFVLLVKRMRDARHKYSALSREFCSKGMKPRQSQEWQDARKLTKQLETEVDEYLKKMEEERK